MSWRSRQEGNAENLNVQKVPILWMFTLSPDMSPTACRQRLSPAILRHMAKRGKADFIFQRPGSENWWIKLRSGGKRLERSLGTPDRRQAEVAALPLIAQHKAALLAVRPRFETIWQHKLEPGREHVGEDGGRIIATDKELIHIGHNGSIVRTEPNGGTAYRLIAERVNVRSLADAYRETNFGYGPAGSRRKALTKNSDDELLETYLHMANITGYYEREARNVWSLYKTLTDSKPLKDADRDDGRKLVAHFENEGLKSATIKKKVGWLNSMVHLAIKEGRLKFNPFSSVVPKRDDRQRRLPLSDDDMKLIKRNLDQLVDSEQLLVRVLAGTGMRLSEAFEIDGEEKERGVRYVIVGKKTEQSLRRVPLPAAVLPFLPKSIKGRLFDWTKHRDPADAASKQLNRFLDGVGITDRRKVVHSLRHRAQDRLRAAECPEDIRWAILGHEERTVAAGYGEGFPVTLLRKWIDKIGF
jgi:integrase